LSYKKVEKILICIYCKSNDLINESNKINCNHCGKYYLVDSKGRLIVQQIKLKERTELTYKLKNYLRNNQKVDNLIYFLFSPVLVNTRQRKKLFKKLSKSDIIINIGGGSTKLANNVINVDIKPYVNVDIVSDCNNLPFADSSVDGIISEVVLEHIQEPHKAVIEMYRVLKPGGYIYAEIPFIQGYHESPGDYQRYTIEGLEELFKDFKKVKIGVSIGPSSALAWILRDYLAILFSFNSTKIYNVLTLLFTPLTWPIKLLDFILVYNKNAHNISSLLYFFGKKE